MSEKYKLTQLTQEDEKDYLLVVADGSDYYIDGAIHVEKNDNKPNCIYTNDEEAAKGAEQDGVKLISDIEGIDKGVYLDIELNRKIIKNYLETKLIDKYYENTD